MAADVTSMKQNAKPGAVRWRCQFRLDDGSAKRISGTSPNKTAARRDQERAKLRALSESRAAPAPKPSPLFSEFAESWLATFPASRNNRKTTIEGKAYHVRKRLMPYLESLTLSNITSKAIDRMVADMRAGGRLDGGSKPLAAKTVANVLQTLRSLLRSAVSWGDLAALPEFPAVKVPKAAFDYLSFEEAAKVLAATKAKAFGAYALLLTAIRTGPRAGELLGLTLDRVDLVKRTIRYDRQLTPGYKLGQVPTFSEVKAGPRTVPMSEEVFEALSTLVAERMRTPTAEPRFVFVRPGRVNPFSRRFFRSILDGALTLAGVRSVHPHALRHTFGSHCAMKGIPIQQIQQWLGHSSITMTMRYAHLSPSAASNDLIKILDA